PRRPARREAPPAPEGRTPVDVCKPEASTANHRYSSRVTSRRSAPPTPEGRTPVDACKREASTADHRHSSRGEQLGAKRRQPRRGEHLLTFASQRHLRPITDTPAGLPA